MTDTTTCEGFAWVGQPFSSCDECGKPYWSHTHDRRYLGPFGAQRLVEITPEMAASVKRKWGREEPSTLS